VSAALSLSADRKRIASWPTLPLGLLLFATIVRVSQAKTRVRSIGALNGLGRQSVPVVSVLR
jgi:hypothetical protein